VSFLVQETTTPEADRRGKTIYQQSAAGINWASILLWKSVVEMPPDEAHNILTFVPGILVLENFATCSESVNLSGRRIKADSRYSLSMDPDTSPTCSSKRLHGFVELGSWSLRSELDACNDEFDDAGEVALRDEPG
jgi:hypothetical protein